MIRHLTPCQPELPVGPPTAAKAGLPADPLQAIGYTLDALHAAAAKEPIGNLLDLCETLDMRIYAAQQADALPAGAEDELLAEVASIRAAVQRCPWDRQWLDPRIRCLESLLEICEQ